MNKTFIKKKFLLVTFFLLQVTLLQAQEVVVIKLPNNLPLQKSLETFLQADTEEARQKLRDFSQEELLEIYSAYRAQKSVLEQRYFWLIEEFLSRQADRVAAERLVYVFLAVSLLMLAIFIFTLLIYFAQRKLNKWYLS